VKNNGTPSISPQIHLLYWGNWTSYPYTAYWSALGTTPAFYNRLREYGVTTGSVVGPTFYAAGATGALTEEQITAGIQAAISYVPSYNETFVVLLPSGTTSVLDTQNIAGGHHSSFANTFHIGVPFAVIEFSSNATTTEWRSSHEVMEASTDPNATSSCYTQMGGTCPGPANSGPINGYCCTAATGGGWVPEIGDACNGRTNQIAGLTTQQFFSNSACRCVREEDLNNIDVNANGYFDNTVFRPTAMTWYALNSSVPDWNFGTGTDVQYGGDYNGDGRTEFSLFRPSVATIFILDIVHGTFTTNPFGVSSDTPTPGDYDGDGKTDLALWDPTYGWRVKMSSTGSVVTTNWGVAGDIPVEADYNNDGVTDYAIVRPSTGTWWVQLNGGGSFSASWTLTTGDVPVAGDFNGDGSADFAFWRPSTGTWFVDYQNTSTAYGEQWGQNGDIPVARDVDGDWLTDLQVWRPSNGTWYVIKSSTWTTASQQWGQNGDVPIGIQN
jgi:hypothetical protein